LPFEAKYELLSIDADGTALMNQIRPLFINEVRWPVAYAQGFAQIRVTVPLPKSPCPSVEINENNVTSQRETGHADAD
jgi:hypothetical protein